MEYAYGGISDQDQSEQRVLFPAHEQDHDEQPAKEGVNSSEEVGLQDVRDRTAGPLLDDVHFAPAMAFRYLGLAKSVHRDLGASDVLSGRRLGWRFSGRDLQGGFFSGRNRGTRRLFDNCANDECS